MATSPLAYSEAPRAALLFADRLFRDAYDVFIEANTGAPWRAETVRDARNARDYFIELIGNKRVGDITHEDALDLRKKLARIPALIGRSVFREREIGPDGRPVLDGRGRPKYRRMAAPDAIARADRIDAERTADIERRLAAGQIDPDNLEDVKRRELVPRLAPKTVNKHLDLTSQLFKWIDSERHQPIRNPFYKTRLKVEGDPRNERPMHTRAQIRALFASPAWTGCSSASRRATPGRTIVKDAFYWIPLLCAHEGARLEEIAQLRTEDVFPIGDVWCLTIRGGKGRRVKSAAAYRTIPIHPLLVELGFVTYVKRMQQAGKAHVFPGLRRDARDRLGGKVSKWSTNYRRAIAQYERGRDGHALRHSFNTYLERMYVMSTRRKELMGHAHTGETDGRYLKPAHVAALRHDLAKLDYGIRTCVRNGEGQISRELTLAVVDEDEP